MKIKIPFLIIFYLFIFSSTFSQNTGKYTLVIHGGAGVISPANLSAEKASQYEAKLTEVLRHGDSILKAGGTSLDAVESCVRMMGCGPGSSALT